VRMTRSVRLSFRAVATTWCASPLRNQRDEQLAAAKVRNPRLSAKYRLGRSYGAAPGSPGCSAAVQGEHSSYLRPHKDKMMLVLGWLTVVLGVLAMLWADGAFAKIDPRPALATMP
jgi:hypothetical protein